MADNSASSLICCFLIVLALNFTCWKMFKTELSFFNNQHPGRCVDGRLSSEPLSAVTGIGVDDSKEHKNVAKMRCAFRVAFYPCNDEGAYTDYDGSCSDFATEPVETDRAAWPLRTVEEEVMECATSDVVLTYDSCDDSDGWDCGGIGSCDAYRKSVRLCAAQLRLDAYPCFGIRDDAAAGVREDASSFPVGWLLGGILCALGALCCCGMFLTAIKEQENFLQKVCITSLVMICIVGVIILINALIDMNSDEASSEDSSDSSNVAFETTLADLADSLGGLNASDALATLQSEVPVETMQWWEILLIVLGSMFGACCLVACCVVCWTMLAGEGEKAREAVVEATPDADGLKLGSQVCLNEEWEIQSGILKPGDVGTVVRVDPGIRVQGVQVCFQGNFWLYPSDALKPCPVVEATLVDEPSNEPSAKITNAPFSSKSIRSIPSYRNNPVTREFSRGELKRAVSSASNLSQAQVVGHTVLHTAENQHQFLNRVGSKMDVFLPAQVNYASVVVPAQTDDYVACPSAFKFEVGDSVMVHTNKDYVKKLCEGGAVTWDDHKVNYIGAKGTVKGRDWLGEGVRVLFPDGHWWSFHPQSLLICTAKLDGQRKAQLDQCTSEGAGGGSRV